MKHIFTLSLLLICITSFGYNEKDTVWQLLEQNKLTDVRSILQKQVNSGTTETDPYFTLMFLNDFEGKEVNLDLMKKVLPLLDDPSPYLYALWFTNAVTNGHNKKEPDRLAFLQQLQQNAKVNPCIKAGNYYIIGMHYMMSNNFPMAYSVWKNIGSIKLWQFTGPFDNTSGSGFDKNYGPVSHPGPECTFESEINGTVKWFIPKHPQKDPYVSTIYHQPKRTAVSYAQTFLKSPADKDVLIGLGVTGGIKVWINDKLVLSNEEEYSTEIDYFKVPAHLNSGYNRILVQLSYTSAETSYPNFIIRILDNNGLVVPGLIATPEYQPYTINTDTTTVIRDDHFAEKYFKEKIAADSTNAVNYILLSKVYERTNRHNDALEILKQAENRYPENVLIKQEILTNLSGLSNRTDLLKYLEDLRHADSTCLLISSYDFETNMNSENYDQAQENLNAIAKKTGIKDPTYYSYCIRLYSEKNMQSELIKTIITAHDDFPENSEFTLYYYYYKKITTNSIKTGMKVLKSYLKTNFNARIYNVMLDEYDNAGMQSSKEATIRKLLVMFPEEKSYLNDLLAYLYSTEAYNEALQYADYGISNDPFNSDFYDSKAYIAQAAGKNDIAEENFKIAISYDPNLFESREMLRTIQGKKAILTILADDKAYSEIYSGMSKPANDEDNYEIIFNNSSNVIFTEGASIEYKTFACRVNTQAGVDTWKEISIGFNSNYQRLIIDKAEVIKPNKQKVPGERNYNEVVFPSLEKGDAIYVVYRLENYTWGKLSKEYFTSFNFSDFAPVQKSVFKLYVPEDYAFDKRTTNLDIEPEVSQVDDFTCYEWKLTDLPRCKDEDYMPALDDVGKYVFISTIKKWDVISNWYRDIALPQAKADYYVNHVYNEIFAGKDFSSQYEKAKAIYEWICTNISYSSVSFRQSNFVPQKPMKTISTQLGDCKDLSLLYLSLARKAGIKTNLVLVSTKNLGENTILLPSINFNHCIVRLELDGKEYFQELTDKTLSFGDMPKTVLNAQALIIPNDSTEAFGKDLIKIPGTNRHLNSYYRKTEINIDDKNIIVNTNLTATGIVASMYRDYLNGSTKSELEDKIKDILDDPFTNEVKVKNSEYADLEKRDSVWTFKGECVVSDEVKSIGSIQILKVPFYEDIFTANAFNEEEREFPVQYWNYEMGDQYTTIVVINIPDGKTIVELPQGFAIKKPYIDYKLEVSTEGKSKVIITRTVSTVPMTIPQDQYKDFQETLKKILKAEDFFVSYK